MEDFDYRSILFDSGYIVQCIDRNRTTLSNPFLPKIFLVGLSADYFHYMADFFSVRGVPLPPPDLKLFLFESQMRMIFTNSGSDYDRSTRRLRISTFWFPLHFLAVSK